MADCLPSINVCACISKMQFRGKYPNPTGELNWDVWFLLLSHLTWHNYAFSRVDRTFVYPQTHFRSFAHMQKAHIELAQNVRYSHGSRVIQNALQRSKILIATHFSVCLVLVAVVFRTKIGNLIPLHIGTQMKGSKQWMPISIYMLKTETVVKSLIELISERWCWGWCIACVKFGFFIRIGCLFCLRQANFIRNGIHCWNRCSPFVSVSANFTCETKVINLDTMVQVQTAQTTPTESISCGQ